jgi:tetratricopeptide (TPR) repeat protein
MIASALRKIEKSRRMTGIPENSELEIDTEPMDSQHDRVEAEIHPLSKVEKWLLGEQHASSSNIRNVPASPFSEISIFEPTRSQAPSVISSIGTDRDMAASEKVKKLMKWANGLLRMKKVPEAASLYREAYCIKKSLGGLEADAEMLDIQFRIAVVFARTGKWDIAEQVSQQVLSKQRTLFGFQKSTTQMSAHFLARVYCRQYRWKEAYPLYTALWDRRREFLHRVTAKSADIELALRTGNEYGSVLLAMDQFVEAVGVLKIIYPECQRVRGYKDAHITLDTGAKLGRALFSSGKISESENLLKTISSLLEESQVPQRGTMTSCTQTLASIAQQKGDYQLAESLARKALEASKQADPTDSRTTIEIYECLSLALMEQGKLDESNKLLREASSSARSILGKTHPLTLRIGIARGRVLLALDKPREAEEVLLHSYQPVKSSKLDVAQERYKIAELLAPLMIQNSGQETDSLKQHLSKWRALPVYKEVFEGQRRLLGEESLVAWQTGHDYGSLCLDLFDYTNAGRVLSQVFNARTRMLGENDPLSISTRFRLGQLYFWMNKEEEAQALLGGVYDHFTKTVGIKDSQTIHCVELLGLSLIAGNPDQKKRAEAWELLQSAFVTRQEQYGSVLETYAAAARLTVLAISQNKVPEAQKTLGWLFHKTNDTSTKYQLLKIMSGMTSVGLSYAGNETELGNRMLQRVVTYVADIDKRGKLTRIVTLGQGIWLFLQRKSRKSRSVLRNYWITQKQISGSRHRRTLLAGEVYATVSILDCVISQKNIHPEVDQAIDWLIRHRRNSPYLIRFSMIGAIVCSFLRLDTISQKLLRWLYETQKRNLGKLSKVTLTTLAVSYALRIRRRFRKKSSRDNTPEDPSVFFPKLWPVFTRLLGLSLQQMQSQNFFTSHLPHTLARMAVVSEITKQAMTQYISNLMLFSVMGPLSTARGEGLHVPDLFNMLNKETENRQSSRVWTIASGDSEAGDAGIKRDFPTESTTDTRESGNQESRVRHDNLTDTAKPAHESGGQDEILSLLNALDDKDADRLSSIGQSLLDFAMGSEEENATMERELDDFQDDLVTRIVTEDDIQSARQNVENLEKDMLNLDDERP